MAEAKKLGCDEPVPILDKEDDETLAAIDRGAKSADEGRVVPLEKVRERMRQWLSKSSSPKTH